MLKVTSLDQLAQYSQGQVVQFPDFGEGQPFVARIKRPSMLALAKTGKIPNSLLNTANGLFAGKGINEKNKSALGDLFQILDVICEDCFLEPTYKDLKEAGVELTDEQLMFIFNYTQKGTKALETFRIQPQCYERSGHVQEVQKDTIGDTVNK